MANHMGKIEARLLEMGIELPEAPKPAAVYIPAITVDHLVFVSGHDCRKNGKFLYQGKIGSDLTLEQGQEAAKQCMINGLASLKNEIGSLDKVKRIVKLLGFVNSAPGFVEQPAVINGASEFLERVFEENGKHARSAIGTSELPFNIPVEIEFIVELKKDEHI